MERHNFFSLPKIDPTTAYQCGTCDFCRQSGVKITALHCKKHFYCRMCEEFAPKFQRRDYRCRVCSERSRVLNDENLQRVDNFFKTKIGGGKKFDFEEIAFTMEGSKVITFDGSDDENNLSGNNDEWENLLETLNNVKSDEKRKSAVKRNIQPRKIKFDIEDEQETQEKESASPELINRTMSFIKMVLPTTEPPYQGSCEKVQSNNFDGTPSCSPTNEHNYQKMSECELGGTTILMPINQKDHLPSPEQPQSRCNSQISNKSKSSSDVERSFSPLKALLGRRVVGWVQSVNNEAYNDEDTSSSDEFAIVEGPGFRYSPDLDTDTHKTKEVDIFWDL